jgi:tetratricopeptide (TPR) repeat protein
MRLHGLEEDGAKKRRRLLSLALFILIYPLGACRRAEEPAADVAALARARELSARGFHLEAARLLRELLPASPRDEQAALHLEIAGAYHRTRLHEAALEHAEEALRRGARSPELLFVKGDSLRHLSRFEEAREILQELLEVAPEHRRGALSLASVRLRLGEAEAALALVVAYLRRAEVDNDADLVEALLERGRALRALGMHREAADAFTEALERDPFEKVACSELATTLYRLRLREEARLAEEIYRSLARGTLAEELTDYLLRGTSSAAAFAQEALTLAWRKRYAEAYRRFESALELADPRVGFHFAELCLRFGRLGDATRLIDEALRGGPEAASGLHWLRASLHLERGEARQALDAARRGLAALEREGDLGGHGRGQAPAFALLTLSARAALEANEPSAAIEAAGAARKGFPDAWEAAYWAGRGELAAGRPAAALELFAAAGRLGGSQHVDLVYSNGLALAAAGYRGEARHQLEQIVRREPAHVEAHEALLELAGEGEARARLEEKLAQARERRAAREELERQVDAGPFGEAGDSFVALAKHLLAAKDPRAFDYLLLAVDLEPANAEALRLLLPGVQRRQDIYFRLHLLRRLLAAAPADDQAAGELVELYLKLKVRLDEASRLARRLEAQNPSERSVELRARAALAAGWEEEARELLRAGSRRYPESARLREALEELEAAR